MKLPQAPNVKNQSKLGHYLAFKIIFVLFWTFLVLNIFHFFNLTFLERPINEIFAVTFGVVMNITFKKIIGRINVNGAVAFSILTSMFFFYWIVSNLN